MLRPVIQYIRRMSDGKNPVTNRPAPENEVLNNMNVHRCLKFIDEVLSDVHKSGGTVGMVSQRAPKQSVSEIFPYEALAQYKYLQDQQISYFLKQLEEYLPEGQKIPVPATTITSWMRENGYLEKKVLNDTGKENSVPTTASIRRKPAPTLMSTIESSIMRRLSASSLTTSAAF